MPTADPDERAGTITAASALADGFDDIEVVVIGRLAGTSLVHVRAPGDRLHVLTPATPGVDLGALHEGQRLLCKIRRHGGRVLQATVASPLLLR